MCQKLLGTPCEEHAADGEIIYRKAEPKEDKSYYQMTFSMLLDFLCSCMLVSLFLGTENKMKTPTLTKSVQHC